MTLFEIRKESNNDIDVDIVCTHKDKPTLQQHLKEYDLTINTYCFDRHGNLLAPLDNYDDWKDPYLQGKMSAQHLMRWLRFKIELFKEIPVYVLQTLSSLEEEMAQLKWGTFKKQLEKLFFNGYARTSLELFIELNVMKMILFPQSQCQLPKEMDQVMSFMKVNSRMLDLEFKLSDSKKMKIVKDPIDIFGKILSLLLLPFLVEEHMRLAGNENKAIDNITDLFCRSHQGFDPLEMNRIKNALPRILKVKFDEYQHFVSKFQKGAQTNLALTKDAPVFVPQFAHPLSSEERTAPSVFTVDYPQTRTTTSP
jgi:hypothetical protein